MQLKLSCYQCKIDYYFIYILYKPHGNNKVKTYSRYTKDKEGNHGIPLQKFINLQKKAAREEEKNKGTTKQPENNKMA